MIRTLVMISGGLDSTALLVHFLTQTRDHVHAHHIHLSNREQRADSESGAVRDIVSYCRDRYRPFGYSDSSWDMPGAHIPRDIYVVMFVAACVASGRHVDRCSVGRIKMRRDIPGPRATYHSIFAASLGGGGPVPKIFCPLKELTKEEVLATIPDDLFRLTRTCRRPRTIAGGYQPCGQCASCRAYQRIQGQLSPDEQRGIRFLE